MSFTDGVRWQVTAKDLTYSWSGEKNAAAFRCRLCGHKFAVGDTARFVYANFKDSPSNYGNFFTCTGCDGPDVLERAAAQELEAQTRFWWLRREG